MEKTIIKPTKTIFLNIPELWRFRELFFVLAWRDIAVRYKQTAIGFFWAILQPIVMMIVFSIVFGKIAGIETGGIPYPIFVYAGLLFWNLFSNSLSAASGSMVANQAIIQKIYFPRILIPLSSTAPFFVDLGASALVFIGLLFYYHFVPSLISLAIIPLCLIIVIFSYAGLGLFFAALNVSFRDVRYALPFFIQLLIFVTPVIYPPGVLGRFEWLWYLNPMSAVIDSARVALLGVGQINYALLLIALLVSFASFMIGLFYFRKAELRFADIV